MQTLATTPSTLPMDASALEASISALKSCISALESSTKTLEASSSWWETLAWSCAFAVGIGIVGEIVVIVSEYLEDREDWRRGIMRAPDHPLVWRFWFDIVATLLVLAGVFGEAGASMQLASINSQLRSKTSELRAKSDQLLVLVTQEVGDAVTSVRIISDESDALQQRLDLAASELSGIEGAVRSQGPRWKLLEDNKAEFVKALTPFPHQKVLVMSCGETANLSVESFGLWSDLIGFLGSDKGAAGWKPEAREWTACQKGRGISLKGGNQIFTSGTSKAAVGNAAKELGDILNKIGILTYRGTVDGRSARMAFSQPDSDWVEALKDPTAVVILVGDNPETAKQQKQQKK